MLLYVLRAIFIVLVTAVLFVSIGVLQEQEDTPEDAKAYYDLGEEADAAGDDVEAKINFRKAYEFKVENSLSGEEVIAMVVVGLAAVIIVIVIDWLTPKKSLQALSGVFFGLIVGVMLSWGMSVVMDMLNQTYFQISPESLKMTNWIMALCICYLSISIVIQTKDDFRFVIPYVEFDRQAKGLRPLVLDTSVIIDGRISDIAKTKLFDAPLVVPRFVLNELQLIADSSDKLKRNRGRRGLDILNKLQKDPIVEVKIDDTPPPGIEANAGVDQKLVAFSKNVNGRLVTNDFNLNKVAQLRGVDVVNINDLANATRTVKLAGEHLSIKVMRPGESAQQGIGYLEDGTMVVIEEARNKIGETLSVEITSSLQTSAGRMIFAKVPRG